MWDPWERVTELCIKSFDHGSHENKHPTLKGLESAVGVGLVEGRISVGRR